MSSCDIQTQKEIKRDLNQHQDTTAQMHDLVNKIT